MKTIHWIAIYALLFLFQPFYVRAQVNETNNSAPEKGNISSTDVITAAKKDKLPAKYDPEKAEKYLDHLFTEGASGTPVLNPTLFTRVTHDSELKGMKVYAKKDGIIYRYLGDQDKLLHILNSTDRQINQCDASNCTTRTCENGTVYNCSCYKGYCMCPLCVDIVTLSDLD